MDIDEKIEKYLKEKTLDTAAKHQIAILREGVNPYKMVDDMLRKMMETLVDVEEIAEDLADNPRIGPHDRNKIGNVLRETYDNLRYLKKIFREVS